MRILLLGPHHPELINYLKSFGDEVTQTESKLMTTDQINIDFMISYRYRHILSGEILNKFPGRAINLHISFLPWNRGADPNLWSFLTDSPKGVSIHYLDNGVDTGDILAQEEVFFSEGETLKSTYEHLSKKIEELLKRTWPEIRTGKMKARKQEKEEGSYHRLKDKTPFLHLLHKGWDTPVKNLIGYACKKEESRE